MRKTRPQTGKHWENVLVLAAMVALVLGMGYKFRDVRAQLQSTDGLDLPPALNLAELSPSYCAHTFEAFVEAVRSRDAEAPLRLWNMLTPDWKNAFIDRCSEYGSIADSCLTLRMKLSFHPTSASAREQFLRKGCSTEDGSISSGSSSSDTSESSSETLPESSSSTSEAIDASSSSDASLESSSSSDAIDASSSSSSSRRRRSGSSSSSSTSATALVEDLRSVATRFPWPPSWNARYRSDRSLLAAQISFAEGIQPFILSAIDGYDACEDLEASMDGDVTFLPQGSPTLQEGLQLFTRTAIYEQFIEQGCLQSMLEDVLQTVEEVSIQFSEEEYVIPSSETQVTVTVERTGDVRGIGSVRYATSDETAFAGVDYTPVRGTLVFPGNVREQSFVIHTKRNLALQGEKTFTVTLSTPTGTATLETETATIVIEGYVESSSSSSARARAPRGNNASNASDSSDGSSSSKRARSKRNRSASSTSAA